MQTTREPSAAFFGNTADGRASTVYTLSNEILRVRITDFGGRIVSIEAPDDRGHRDHVVLGFDQVADYQSAGGAFGALLGRIANRIAEGRFTLDGHSYAVPTNEPHANLHGGPEGFDDLFWRVERPSDEPQPTLVCTHVSPDGHQGFPGEVSVRATYRLAAEWLWLTFEARTTRPTLLSLSAHPYFNLAGPDSGSILGHELTLPASHFLPTDAHQIPTGEIRAVIDTPFDFRSPRTLGQRIREPEPQLLYGQGYDHYFILDESPAETARLAARVVDGTSGRLLELHTNTGNQLRGCFAGRGGIYRQSAGFALEPQGYPDAIHHPHFPTIVLRPAELYACAIGYRFGSVPRSSHQHAASSSAEAPISVR
jgi:aldose 1-epimerase